MSPLSAAITIIVLPIIASICAIATCIAVENKDDEGEDE